MAHRRQLFLALAIVAHLTSATVASGQVATLRGEVFGTSGTEFGIATALEGTTAVIGAGAEGNFVGAAYIYRLAGGTWTRQQRLTASDAATSMRFGSSVALSGDTLVVGAFGARIGATGSRHGAAYVFVWNGTAWVQQAKLVASDVSDNAQFGWATAIDGNTVVVGAHNSAVGGAARGQAYVFERTGTVWQERTLTAPGVAAGDKLGGSVGVLGDTVCVGATGDTVGANAGQGSAFIFTRSGAAWNFQQQLLAGDGAAGDAFGGGCALDGDTVAIGAASDDGATLTNQGSVYVFTRAAATWSLQQKVTASDPSASAGFGAVALDGDLMAVGAGGELGATGAAYLFQRTGTSWRQLQKVRPTAGAGLDSFGIDLAIAGTVVVIGAPSYSLVVREGRAAFYDVNLAAGTPGAPTNLQASANGNQLTLSWAAGAGGAPTSYTLLARSTSGGAATLVPVGTLTTVSGVVPNGTYIVSVRAANALGTGPESSTVTIAVPNLPTPPGAPGALTATVLGNTATFTWTAPVSGGPVGNYVIVAGLTPGFAVPLGSLPLPAGSTTTAIPGIPPGTYYLRVLAQNAGGTSAGSNEVTVAVAAPAAPGAPTLNPPTVAGNTVGLSWTPGGGGAPTSYVLTALTSGGVVLGSAPLSGSSASFPGVPSGSYLLRLVAVNSVGPSPVSNTVTLVVP